MVKGQRGEIALYKISIQKIEFSKHSGNRILQQECEGSSIFGEVYPRLYFCCIELSFEFLLDVRASQLVLKASEEIISRNHI